MVSGNTTSLPSIGQADLDRFWFQRCETADVLLDNLDQLSERFAAIWERRRGYR